MAESLKEILGTERGVFAELASPAPHHEIIHLFLIYILRNLGYCWFIKVRSKIKPGRAIMVANRQEGLSTNRVPSITSTFWGLCFMMWKPLPVESNFFIQWSCLCQLDGDAWNYLRCKLKLVRLTYLEDVKLKGKVMRPICSDIRRVGLSLGGIRLIVYERVLYHLTKFHSTFGWFSCWWCSSSSGGVMLTKVG